MAVARVPIFYTRVGKGNSAGHLRVVVKADKCRKTVMVLRILLLAAREAEYTCKPAAFFITARRFN